MAVRRWGGIGALLLTLGVSGPAHVQGQQPRRWLADPQQLGHVQQVGPTGGVQTGNAIFDIDLLSPTSGWAASYQGLLRFDGRYWRPLDPITIPSAQALGVSTVSGLEFFSADDGWAIGTTQGSGPPSIFLQHFDGISWHTVYDVVRKDGTPGPLYGVLNDLALTPDGMGWAIGYAYNVGPDGTSSGSRPLLLQLLSDGWHDVTPDNWQNLALTALSAPGGANAWIGATRLPTANAPAQALILVSSFGGWVEQPLPELPSSSQPFSITEIVMSGNGQGWAIFTDAGTRCAASRLLRYSNDAWSLTPAEAHGGQAIRTLALLPGTERGWATVADCTGQTGNRGDRRMRFDNGVFVPDVGGSPLAPTIYALLSDDVQLGAATGYPMRFSAEVLPTDRVGGAPSGARYFSTTGHTLSGAFRRYYETHGLELGDRNISDRESLALFGYPTSEPFTDINPDTGALLRVQYFERARMEEHPTNPEPYKVLLGRLGASTAIGRFGGITQPLGNVPATPAACSTFGETGYDLCPPFRQFWERNGGLAVYGFPITAARDEQSTTDRTTYLTQWFERERLESHPEHVGTPYSVLLGLLGSEELRLRGYVP